VSRNVPGIAICLDYAVLTCVKGCSLHHHLSDLCCAHLCPGTSWHHHLFELCCAHLCPETSWIHHLSELCCAMLTYVKGCSWHYHISKLYCAHLCPGTLMPSPSVLTILCSLVYRDVHDITICLSYTCSLVSRNVHGHTNDQ